MRDHDGDVAFFRRRYGPWALVTGAAQGLGRAFAEALAGRGLSLVLVDQQQGPLAACAARAAELGAPAVRMVALDLARDDFYAELAPQLEGLELGLLVSNAALSPIGPFFAQPLPLKLRALQVNCRAPLVLCHELGLPMRQRGRGGLILLASLSGRRGTPLVATYAATKAFSGILGESLWSELRTAGVDALAVLPGVTDTEGFRDSAPRRASLAGRGAMQPAAVVAEALAALGKQPLLVPGLRNRVAGALLERLLPTRVALALLARSIAGLYPDR